jgi:hypothetical protein
VWAAGFGDPDIPQWVFAVAAKGRRLELDLAHLPRLAEAQERFERAEGQFRIGPLRMGARDLARTVARDGPRVVRERLRARYRGAGRSR